MFQTQQYFEGFTSTPTFVRERSMNRSLTLLQMTQHVRDGRHRLPTPDKSAVLDLSTSFEKRRLGKQQRILSDIAARCREQEIEDLSTQIAEKMVLKEGNSEPVVSTYATNFMMKREKTIEDVQMPQTPQIKDRNYKFFPARKIIKHPSKTDLPKTSSPRVRIAYIKHMAAFVPNSRSKLLETQPINGPIQLEHYMQPKLDPLAPLIRNPSSLDSDYQNRIDSYFSTGRMSLGQRSKTMWESGSGVSCQGQRSARPLKPIKTKTEVETPSDTDSPGPPVSQESKSTDQE